MINYPVDFPSSEVNLRRRRIWIDFNEAVFESKFSRQEQIQGHAAGKSDRWVGLWTTTTLTSPEMACAEAFLYSLKGRKGTFKAYDPDRRIPGPSDPSGVLFAGTTLVDAGTTLRDAGEGFSSPGICTVNGSNQTGTTLGITCEAVNTTVMTKGDYFQVGIGYHCLIVDPLDTNGLGNTTLEFEPALRTSPKDNDVVTVINPKMIARLDVQYRGADTGAGKSGVVSFSFHEDIAQ